MAYSNWGAFVYQDGRRRRDKEDVGVYDTDEAGLPSGLRVYANLVKNEEAVRNEPWRRSQHGVMGDGAVRVACYKDLFPTVYVWDGDADAPREIAEPEIIAHNGWEGEPFVSEWTYDGKTEKYIDYEETHGELEFTVPGLDGYRFTACNGEQCNASMEEPDGTRWECSHGYMYGAGFED